MEFLVIIGLIVWAVVTASQKKQARNRQAEQNRRAVQHAERQAAPQAAQPAAPLRPRVQPTVAPQTPPKPVGQGHVVQPSRASGHYHTESSMTGFEPCPPNAGPRMDRPLADRLAEFKAAKAAAARSTQQAAWKATEETPTVVALGGAPLLPFSFDPAQVRNGLIYAEILGKPKALRR